MKQGLKQLRETIDINRNTAKMAKSLRTDMCNERYANSYIDRKGWLDCMQRRDDRFNEVRDMTDSLETTADAMESHLSLTEGGS